MTRKCYTNQNAIEIIGITAVEDKLQDYIADTISRLKKGGIKVWVLTGDKLETARNIGFSCSVLSDDREIIVMDTDPENAPGTPMDHMVKASQTAAAANENKPGGILITGSMLEAVFADLGDRLLELGEMCDVVIACRVSPSQKGEVVKLVRYGVKPVSVTLAIGDGANDVAILKQINPIRRRPDEREEDVDSCIFDGFLQDESKVYVTLTGGCPFEDSFDVCNGH